MTSNSNIDEMIVDEFKDKTFRECAEIIVGNPKDKDWTDMQINQLVKLHEQAIQQELLKAELKGFDKAFDSHDYDGLRKYKSDLQAKLKGDE